MRACPRLLDTRLTHPRNSAPAKGSRRDHIIGSPPGPRLRMPRRRRLPCPGSGSRDSPTNRWKAAGARLSRVRSAASMSPRFHLTPRAGLAVTATATEHAEFERYSLNKYLTGKHPPEFLHKVSGPVITVSRSLTRRTGVTMVSLRKTRRLWSARAGRCEMPNWTPEEFAAIGRLLDRRSGEGPPVEMTRTADCGRSLSRPYRSGDRPSPGST